MNDGKINHRSVYAKGYFDGLEARRKDVISTSVTLTGRMQSVLNGQSSVAKKVFEVVPIQEAWTANQIAAALNRVTKSTLDKKILDGCLNSLKECSLIKEPRIGFFQRANEKTKSEVEPVRELVTICAADVKVNAAVADTLDSGPANKVFGMCARIRQLAEEMKGLATEIETEALMLEEEASQNEESAAHLKILKSVLKGIA